MRGLTENSEDVARFENDDDGRFSIKTTTSDVQRVSREKRTENRVKKTEKNNKTRRSPMARNRFTHPG